MPDLTRHPAPLHGVDLCSVSDPRFKTCRLSVSFLLPLSADTSAAQAILPFLLKRACRAYPDITALNRRLSELYGAHLFADAGRIGENQYLTIALSSIANRFALAGEDITKECAELLCALIFDPPMEGGRFRAADIEQEKRCLIQLIESEQSDKRTYARRRCEEVMCAGEAYGVHRYGTIEAVEALTEDEIHKAWERALRDARVSLTCLGDGDPSPLSAAFVAAAAAVGRGSPLPLKTDVIRAAGDLRRHTDRMPVNQAKLVMGFRAGIAEPDAEVFAARLMTALWGGTPHSMLFLNVRERLNLCYYCAARYDRQKGLLFVECGVDEKNAGAAEAEILRQLERLRAGDFTAEDLSAAQMSVANAFLTVSDSPATLASWYDGQLLDASMLSPMEAAARVGAVTAGEVTAAARRVSLDTVYLLAGEEEKEA